MTIILTNLASLRFKSDRLLEKKLDAFKDYYNGYRVHVALEGEPPLSLSGDDVLGKANINKYRWNHIAEIYFKRRWQLELQFATYMLKCLLFSSNAPISTDIIIGGDN